MKKIILIICAVAFTAIALTSCSQHSTCPAYRGSVAMVATE